MRLLLGAAEAGLFPGVMLYLTYWFGREERARATGYFLLGVCVANIVGGPLGGALLELDGSLGFHGWQWLFVIEGVPAILLAFVVWKMLPDRPTSAPWLSREDAIALERRLAAEQDAQGGRHGTGALRSVLGDRQVWLAILVYFCHQLTIYTVIFFLPGIIGASGKFSPLTIGLLSATPWVAAAIGAATLPRFASDSSKSRRILIAGLVIMASGMLIAAWASPVIGLLGVCLSALMFFVVQSIIFTFPQSRLSGSALAGGLGLVNSCGLLGGFVGPTVMGIIEQTTGRAMNGLVCLAIALLFAAVCSTRLRHGNEDRADDQRGVMSNA
jgi:MFS family permease